MSTMRVKRIRRATLFDEPSKTDTSFAYQCHTPYQVARFLNDPSAAMQQDLRHGIQPTAEDLEDVRFKTATVYSEWEEMTPEQRGDYENPLEYLSQRLYEASQANLEVEKGGTSGEGTPPADGGESPPEESLDDS